ILHVIDASDSDFDNHIRTTESLLTELDLERIPRIRIYNKADQLDPRRAASFAQEPGALVLSALDPTTFAPLLARIEALVFEESDDTATHDDAAYGAADDVDGETLDSIVPPC